MEENNNSSLGKRYLGLTGY